MKFYRIWALIERDMRKYFRSPALMMTTMVLPLMQLIVLGYAFGGKIKNAPVAVVDEDHSVESRRVQEMFDGITAGPQTLRVVNYDSLPNALADLRTGLMSGVVDIPARFLAPLLSARPPAHLLQRGQHGPVHRLIRAGGSAGNG